MKLRVIQISESAFSVQGHGVHTAFTETVRGLRGTGSAVVSENSFSRADIRHIHTVGPYSLVHLLLGSGKKIVSAHVVPESFVGSLVGARYWLGIASWYLRWFYNRADCVLAVSDETRDELIKLGVKKPIEVVYNMVDTSRYKTSETTRNEARKSLEIAAGTNVVVGNGQVQPRKRVDTFIDLAHKLPEFKFIWVGGMPFGRAGAQHASMQNLISSAPKNVLFTGVVALEDVKSYFAASDIFIMTSEQETFGLAIVEAAASGLPVVLRKIPDYDNTFRDNAVMCDQAEFESALVKLAQDKKYYQSMQKHSGRIAHRFDSKTIAKKLLDVYQSCLVDDDTIDNK